METAYYPRRLGVLSPRGEAVHEVVVVGEDRVGSLEGVLQIFKEHFVNLLFTTAYDSTASGDFMLNTFADLSRAEGSLNDIKKQIGQLPYVKSVQMEKVDGGRFSRFLFPVVAGQNRVMIFGAGSMAAIEKRMTEAEGEKGRETLLALGHSAGLEVATELRKFLPWAKSTALMVGAVDQLRAFGWGIFSFDTNSKQGSIKVTVRKPSFSEVPDATGSMVIIGLASGVLEGASGLSNEVSGRPTYSHDTLEYSFELKPNRPAAAKKK